VLLCRYAQPALFVAGLAAAEQLRADNPDVVAGCSAVAGLSLGEYTALVFAGALSFEDGLKVLFLDTFLDSARCCRFRHAGTIACAASGCRRKM